MKTLLTVIIAIHGIIHLLGFIKGFDIKEVKGLTMPISPSMGLVWLLAFLLMMVLVIMQYTKYEYAWLIALGAVVVSQTLIFFYWKDAKFGTIPNILILLVAIVGLGAYVIKNDFKNNVIHDFRMNNAESTDTLTESDIKHLPLIVQKYLHYTKSVGKPRVKNFKAEFVGGMRSKPDEPYMKVSSVQYNFHQNPSRHFYMEATKMGIPATGLHTYKNESATFVVCLLNWYKIVNARGEKLNQSETVTLFNDMCFISPAMLADQRISWEQINDTTVNSTFTNHNISISATLYFNQEGELQNFISMDRYHTDGSEYFNYPWATPVSNYKMINGYFLPSKALLIYQKPEGDFIYGELEYKSVKYNLPQIE